MKIQSFFVLLLIMVCTVCCGTPQKEGEKPISTADAGTTLDATSTNPPEQKAIGPDNNSAQDKTANNPEPGTAQPDAGSTPDNNTSQPEPQPEPAQPEPAQPELTKPPERSAPPEVRTPPKADYTQPLGPLTTKALSRQTVQLPSSTGCSRSLCTVYLDITYPSNTTPTRKPPYPLAIVSNGFLLGDRYYATYAKRLASWGYVVIRWDTNRETPFGYIKHDALGKMLIEIINHGSKLQQSGALQNQMDLGKVFLVGHSRGGKASVLAAQKDKRVVGVFGIDPVNSAPQGARGSVSALTQMASMKAPLAVIGAGKGGSGFQACAPTKDNYSKFYQAANPPAWQILIPDAGHMQFLDTQSGCLPCFACTKGQKKDADIRNIAQIAMVMWAEKTTRSVDISSFLNGKWSQSITSGTTFTNK